MNCEAAPRVGHAAQAGETSLHAQNSELILNKSRRILKSRAELGMVTCLYAGQVECHCKSKLAAMNEKLLNTGCGSITVCNTHVPVPVGSVIYCIDI